MERSNDESMSDLVRELQARRNDPKNLETLKSARSRTEKSFKMEKVDISKQPEATKNVPQVVNSSWIARFFRSLSCIHIEQVNDPACTTNSKRTSKTLSSKNASREFDDNVKQMNAAVDDDPLIKISKERLDMYEGSASMMSTRSFAYETEQMQASFLLPDTSDKSNESSFYTTPPLSYYSKNKPWANEPRPESMSSLKGSSIGLMPVEMNRSQLRIDTTSV
jgi:hypothetical protein